MKKPFSLFSFVALFLVAMLAGGMAHAEKADSAKPMNIEADALRHDDLKQISVFTGNVVINQQRGSLSGQRVVYNMKTGQVESGGGAGGGRVKMRILPKSAQAQPAPAKASN